ncbi:MAG TPA: ImmA/IrrE family metallo-endopeptidase [Jatrophihabitans sp.]|nr:ImmA/IrrE family metallo-endopeptidase [Jatrophihabitans sp.]
MGTLVATDLRLPRPPAGRYDPWRDVRLNWPEVRVVIERMTGDLLGEARDGGAVIALRAGTSAAQRRCTLAHEIVHLERGLRDCGQWLHREEQAVHRTAARRLITLADLVAALRDLGGADDPGALAQALDVDRETLSVRLATLDRDERRALRRALAGCAPLWAVA